MKTCACFVIVGCVFLYVAKEWVLKSNNDQNPTSIETIFPAAPANTSSHQRLHVGTKYRIKGIDKFNGIVVKLLDFGSINEHSGQRQYLVKFLNRPYSGAQVLIEKSNLELPGVQNSAMLDLFSNHDKRRQQ
jgi:hypothetical protein